jgi:hypothetical protein
MIVHPILEAMLRGQLRSSGDVAGLVAEKREAGRKAGREAERSIMLNQNVAPSSGSARASILRKVRETH